MDNIRNHVIFKEAMSETISNPHAQQMPISAAVASPSPLFLKDENKRRGFITATPGTIIGALMGAGIGGALTKDHSKWLPVHPAPAPRKKERSTDNFETNDYYDQVVKLQNNLKVVFTPISAIYIVKDKGKEITIDTVETEEMNEDMYNAWQRKDYMYFKNIIINKMYSEIQFVEKSFAKKILEKQMDVQKRITKNASYYDIDIDDITDMEIAHYTDDVRDFYSKGSDMSEKLASAIVSEFDDRVEYSLADLQLDRPFDKYAGAISDTLNMVGLRPKNKDISSLQGKFLNPRHLGNNVKVGFFPDRVIFVVDDKLVGTLPSITMNEEGFHHFKDKNSDYFEKYFKKEVQKGYARINGKDGIGKQANEEGTVDEREILTSDNAFVRSDVNPVVYFLLLTDKYGYEWVDFEGYALIQMIEKDFMLPRPLGSIAINKVMSVKAANNGDVAYTSRHAFEKIIRSFNNKPIDFMQRENDDMSIVDFVHGLDIMNRVTPYDNIYDNFSPEVYDYIVKTLADDEDYVWGVNVTGTEEENQFITTLNYSLLNEINNRFTSKGNLTQEDEDDIMINNEIIFEVSSQLIPVVNEYRSSNPSGNFIDFTESILMKSSVDKNLTNIITRQIVKNVILDTILDEKENELMTQLGDLGLHKK